MTIETRQALNILETTIAMLKSEANAIEDMRADCDGRVYDAILLGYENVEIALELLKK
jgi:hypothetical protein